MKAFLSAFLSWTLSILLAWEPFAFSASKTFDVDIKNFVGETHMTQKRLTLNELYNLNSRYLPKEAREFFKPANAQMGNYLLPKFDITRVKGPSGEEAYQFSASQDGKAISFMIVNGADKIFLRVNGQNISLSDHITLNEYFKKFGMTDLQVTQAGMNRSPASASVGHKLLSAEQIMRMSKSQQVQYFKQLRALMQSIEETQNAMGLGGKRTSSDARIPSDKYSILFALLNPNAQAQNTDSGRDCVAGGYTATVAWNNKRIDPQTGKVVPGYSCGTDGNGGVPSQYRGSCAGSNDFLCNPVLYGSGGGHCAPAGADTTKFCNTIVKGNDIPDLSQNRDEFNSLKSKAENQATTLLNACSANKFQADQIRKDQAWTCQNLRDRYTTIESWNCANADFAKGYPKLCKDATFNPPQASPPPVAEQPPQAPQPPTVVTPPAQSPDGAWYCDSLPGDMFYPQIKDCPMPGATADESATCLDRSGPSMVKARSMPATKCTCVAGDMSPDYRCLQQPGDNSGTADGSDSHSRRHKKAPPIVKGPNWWVILGAGLAGAYLLYRIDKSSANNAFNYQAAIATSTSTSTSTSTVTTLPTPRVLNGVR